MGANPHLDINAVSREEGQFRKRRVLSGTQTLTVSQSGALCLFDAATGSTFTLPAITASDVGTWFEFFVKVTVVAADVHKVITDAATTYILGSVFQAIEATTPDLNAGPKDFVFNGSSNIAVLMDGSVTGGIIGTRFILTAISTTQWLINGYIKASGTIATPASDS